MRHIYDFKKTVAYGTPIRRRQKSNYGGREKIMVVLFLLVVIGWIYTFYFSPIFKIQNITITGHETISDESIKQLLSAKDKNLFRFNINKMKQAIHDGYFIDEATIVKIYPHSLKVIIKEKHPAFELSTPVNNYLLDQDGFVLRLESASGTPRINEALPQVKTVDDKIFNIRNQAIDSKKIQAINFFITNLKTEDNIDIASTAINTEEGEVLTMKTTEGFDIITSYKEDNKTQLFKLTAFFKDQGEKRKNLLYINARFVDRVYFKFKN